MIDTHCHLTFKHYAGRVGEILAAARSSGVRGCITVATTSSDCVEALELARAHADVWCSAGVHPLHSDEPIEWSNIHRVGQDPKCVAWGELGLDHYYQEPARATQAKVLSEQLALIESWSREGLIKPIIVHCREAFDALLSHFLDGPFEPSRFVFHCFTGSPDDARKVLDFGGWISFTGVVTYKNAPNVADAAKLVPLDRMMVETDAPFLSPEPVRTMRPNEPKNVVHVANFIAQLRGVGAKELEHQLDANAERFFGISLPPAQPEAAAHP